MDDSETIVLTLRADAEIKGWLAKHHPMLILGCKTGETPVPIAWVDTGTPAKVESGNSATVRFRYDQEEAVTVSASRGSRKGIVLPNPLFHMQTMLDHERLLVEFTPLNAAPQTMAFTLHGLDQVIGPLHAACGWE